MDLGLDGKVAIVTGASRGLGFASAEALAREGCRVAVVGRTRQTIDAAAERIGALAIVADMAVPEDPERVVAEATAALGPVQIVVANAGGPAAGGFSDVSEHQWEAALQQNLMGTVRLIRSALPAMRSAGWGRVVTITSRTVREAIDGLVLSNATRAAVAGVVRTLAREVAKEGVLVNNVMPGSFATERLVELYGSEEAVAERGAASVIGRIGDPGELGALVAFLSSERASFITGASILIDGGEATVIA